LLSLTVPELSLVLAKPGSPFGLNEAVWNENRLNAANTNLGSKSMVWIPMETLQMVLVSLFCIHFRSFFANINTLEPMIESESQQIGYSNPHGMFIGVGLSFF
jgi:hypothetical protein